MGQERQIELAVVTHAVRAGWVARKVSWQGRRSAPDHVFFGHGRCVFIEFKAPGKEPNTLQAREKDRLRAAYMDMHVCDNLAAALKVLGIPHGG